MNTQPWINRGLQGLAITGLTAVLVACGGGSSSSSTGGTTDVVARGVITQLGSIYVNGVKWETPASGTYTSDDNPSSGDSYEVGQVVSIRGQRNDDGVTGTASEVEYEAEVEGTADASGQILGITIIQTPNTNAPGIPDPLAENIRYEVSGLWIDDSTMEATFIKVDDDVDSQDEIKGFVENDGASSFDVRGITFNWTDTPDVADGDYVEVHFESCSGTSPNVTCTATSVELEDDYFDEAEGLEVEIEGAVDLVTTGCPAEAEFKVDGVCIDSTTAEWMDGLLDINDLVQGSRVEAEGHMVAATPVDYLRADKVKGRGNRVRVTSIASNASGDSFQLVGDKIDVTTMTGVTDYDGVSPGNIDSGDALDGIEVRGVRTGPNSMLALRIKLDGLSSGNRHEIRAEVDADSVNTDSNIMSVMGIFSQANSDTELEIDDVVISTGNGSTTNQAIDDFLLQVDDNTDPNDGPRDVVEIGIDLSTGANGSAGSPYPADEWEIEEEDD